MVGKIGVEESKLPPGKNPVSRKKVLTGPVT